MNGQTPSLVRLFVVFDLRFLTFFDLIYQDVRVHHHHHIRLFMDVKRSHTTQ